MAASRAQATIPGKDQHTLPVCLLTIKLERSSGLKADQIRPALDQHTCTVALDAMKLHGLAH